MENKQRDLMNVYHKASNAPFSLTITINRELPNIDSSLPLDSLDSLYNFDAERIFQNLYNVLPQATLNRLLVKMLEHQAGFMRLSYSQDKKSNG